MMGREEGLVVQFKECVLVTMTHPLELKLRTSTKDPKARSRVGKQARSQSSHTAPHWTAVLCCVPFWRLHHIDQQKAHRASRLALELGPVLLLPTLRPAVYRRSLLFFVMRMIISFFNRR